MNRPELSRLVGRTVTAEATYTTRTRIRRQDGRCLRLVRNVHVYPSFTLDHLWVDLPDKEMKRLKNDQRFSFLAQVECYERSNGSEDIGLNVTRVLT